MTISRNVDLDNNSAVAFAAVNDFLANVDTVSLHQFHIVVRTSVHQFVTLFSKLAQSLGYRLTYQMILDRRLVYCVYFMLYHSDGDKVAGEIELTAALKSVSHKGDGSVRSNSNRVSHDSRVTPLCVKVTLRGMIEQFDQIEKGIIAVTDIYRCVGAWVEWKFASDGYTSEKRTFMEKDWTLRDSYYPYLGIPYTEYQRRFIESRSNILIVSGAPGTGKTYFIRDLICEYHLECWLTYDRRLMTDEFFSDWLFSDSDLLIMEDADEILHIDRSGDVDGKLSRLLNASDGLLRGKKIILTSNLPRGNIDEALLRPGRCFDVIEFPELDYAHSLIVAQDIGLTKPLEKQSYTLAQLHHMLSEDNAPVTDRSRSFGLVRN